MVAVFGGKHPRGASFVLGADLPVFTDVGGVFLEEPDPVEGDAAQIELDGSHDEEVDLEAA